MARFLYLAGYDISEEICQETFRQVVKSYAIMGQKSAYECHLTRREHQQLQEFFEANISSDDACCLIKIKDTLWQTTPKHQHLTFLDCHCIYIG